MKGLRRAVCEDNAEMVYSCLSTHRQTKPITNRWHREIGMLLHMTVNIEIAKLLVDFGAIVDVRNKIKETPLFSAARNHDCTVDYIEFLIAHSADVNAQNHMDNTPLHCALIARNYKLNVIRCLLRHGASINAVNVDGDSPLHIVARNRDIKVDPIDSIREILKQKLPINLIEDENDFPSIEHHIGSLDSPVSIMRELLENGADVNLINFAGKSALHYAVKNDDSNVDVVTELIKYEADTSAITPDTDYTPLHFAVSNMNSKLGIVEAILATNVDIEALDTKKNTPLHLAVGNHNTNFEVIKMLLNQGANVNALNNYSNTPLHISAKTKPFVLKELLKWSPDINAKNYDGDSPLAIALRYNCGFPYVVRYLLEAGADVNCVNSSLDTPLHLAVENCDITFDVLKEVLITGILDSMKSASDSVRVYLDQVKTDTNTIKKCLDRIKSVNPPSIEENRKNKLLVIEELLQHGARVDAKAIQGGTPLDASVNKLESKLDDGLCSKLLIKYTVLKHFKNHGYRVMVDLSNYEYLNCYPDLLNYLISCVDEVENMKKDKIQKCLTLYDFVVSDPESGVVSELCDEAYNQVVEALIERAMRKSYPTYSDIITNKIKRSMFETKMMNCCIYSVIAEEGQTGDRKISLDAYATCCVIQFLPQSDLLNLTLAFCYDLNDASSSEANSTEANSSDPPRTGSVCKRAQSASASVRPKYARVAKLGKKKY